MPNYSGFGKRNRFGTFGSGATATRRIECRVCGCDLREREHRPVAVYQPFLRSGICRSAVSPIRLAGQSQRCPHASAPNELIELRAFPSVASVRLERLLNSRSHPQTLQSPKRSWFRSAKTLTINDKARRVISSESQALNPERLS